MSHLEVEAYIKRQIPETWDEILASDESGLTEIGFSDLGFGPREIAQLVGIKDSSRIPRSAEEWRDLAMGVIATSDVQVEEKSGSSDDAYGLYGGW